VKENFDEGRLQFTTDAELGVKHGRIQFIAVGTPPDEDGSADLQYVLAEAKTIATYMVAPKIIVDKSTVPVGTSDKVSDCVNAVLEERGLDLGFDVVSNPEFLKEGAAVADCQRPDRIVMGTKESALTGADALVDCPEWNAFKAPDFHLLKATLNHAVIFDGRNLYDPNMLKQQGIAHYGIGRGRSVLSFS
jgi:UDP-glucose 6-dehydrogenase